MGTFSNFWIWLGMLIPGLSKSLRNDLLDKVTILSTLVKELGNFLKEDLLNKLAPKFKEPIIINSKLRDSFSKVFSSIDNWFDFVKEELQNHASSIAEKIEPDENMRAWRMFGYFFQLCFLALFIYADTIQIFNNLALIFPQDFQNTPEWLSNLSISLIMSSVGIAIAASFIFAEFAGVTFFGKWHELKGAFRNIVKGLSWFCLLSIIIIDTILALSRIKSIPEIAQLLSPELTLQISLWAAIASSLVILPMIIITFLFFSGFVGISVIYIVFIWIVSLFVELIHLIFIWLVWLFTYGLTHFIDFFTRAIIFIIVGLLFILGWTFSGTGSSINGIIELIKSILNLVYFPMDSFFSWLSNKINSSLAN